MKIEELKKLVISTLEDMKAEDILVLDVKDKTSVTDWIVVASGSSSRHVKSMANNLLSTAKEAGANPLGCEGQEEAEWVLVDLGDVIVHVMQRQAREYYDLESLWSVDVSHRQNQDAI